MEHYANTGGMLNELNGIMGTSAPSNSVPVIKLINTHNPQSYDELEQLIEYHYLHDCPCGIKSKGTVRDFGKNLYEAQDVAWGEKRFTLDECIQWMYNLFIINSLKGSKMEKLALNEVQQVISSQYQVRKAESNVDERYRVDLEICNNDTILLGIQVKPHTYVFTNEYVQASNNAKNSRYGYDVFYLYYNDEGLFVNIEDINDFLNDQN